ncbi:MAG: NAD-dependent succinate-semialdehyde dehydrogenase [Legionellaceae bacterium]|nr:NAD-dependent succinate-semialdehyde dehydrogenase [Legionellaceae bacterium]
MMIQTINPATGEVIQSYSELSKEAAYARIRHAEDAYALWRKTTWDERRTCIKKLADCLRAKKEEYAHLMALEMGKPLQAGLSEIEKCVWVCEHYVEHAEAYLAAEPVQTNMKHTKVVYRPLGVIFAIMPWNFPFWQVFRYAVPTIAAGNTTILKHAPISSGTGEAISDLFLEAGFPKHIFQHMVLNNQVASDVIAHQAVVGVTFTGSAFAGSQIAALAGKHLKRVVLELGGSDPAVVLADADVQLAAEVIVASRLNNTGQVCIAAKRIIAVTSVKEKLLQAMKACIKKYPVGHPLDKNTVMGPMARADLRDTVHAQVEASIQKGAQLELGGVIPDGEGFYYPVTILTDVMPGMAAFDDEIFGPVIALIEARDESEAIQLANQTEYGLGASIFTQDEVHGEMLAADVLEAGTCFVNGKVSSDPRMPFGGIKQSGFGRELAREGILAFVNMKTVGIGHA